MPHRKEDKTKLKRMQKLIDSTLIYYNFCIPTHKDGRTAAEFACNTPLDWLRPIIQKYKEKELPFFERELVEQDLHAFTNRLLASILDGTASKQRLEAVREIDRLLNDESHAKEFEKAQFLAFQEWRGEKPDEMGKVEDDADLPIQIILPYVTICSVINTNRALAKIRRLGANLDVLFHDGTTKVMVRRDGRRSLAIFTGKDGTKLGTVEGFGNDTVVLSSIAEERHRALRDLVVRAVGEKEIKIEREMRDVLAGELDI